MYALLDEILTPLQEAYLETCCYPWCPDFWEISNVLAEAHKVQSGVHDYFRTLRTALPSQGNSTRGSPPDSGHQTACKSKRACSVLLDGAANCAVQYHNCVKCQTSNVSCLLDEQKGMYLSDGGRGGNYNATQVSDVL